MSQGCPACGVADARFLLKQRPAARLRFREEFEIVQCPACRHAWVSNVPTPDELAAMYDAAFFSTSQQSAAVDERGEFTAEAQQTPIFINAERRVRQIESAMTGSGDGPRPRLLDIGCANGVFLKLAARRFEVLGVDVSPEAVEHARERLGLPALCGDFERLDLPASGFDVITLWDVLASLRDPAASLRRIATLLKPGGRLIMTLPDIDSLSFRLLRRFWPLLIPPINLHYFSPASTRALLAQAGLRLERYHWPGKTLSVNFVLRKLGRILGVRILDNERVGLPGVRRVYLNLGDIAEVWAQSTTRQAEPRP